LYVLRKSNSPNIKFPVNYHLLSPKQISCIDLLQYNCSMIMIRVNIITCRNAVALVYLAYPVATSFSIGGGAVASFTMILHILALIYKNFFIVWGETGGRPTCLLDRPLGAEWSKAPSLKYKIYCFTV